MGWILDQLLGEWWPAGLALGIGVVVALGFLISWWVVAAIAVLLVLGNIAFVYGFRRPLSKRWWKP